MCKNNFNEGHLRSYIVDPALDVVVPDKAHRSKSEHNHKDISLNRFLRSKPGIFVSLAPLEEGTGSRRSVFPAPGQTA